MAAGSQAFAQGACPPGAKMSKQIAKPMDAANKALQARKWNEVLARVREAAAVTGYIPSEYDKFWQTEFKGYAYHQLGQLPDAARELEAGLASPCMAEGKKQDRLKALAALYYQMKNYPKSIDYANRALKYGRDTELMVTLGQAYSLSGNQKEAQRVMNEVINSSEQGGRAPKENTLLQVLDSCRKVNDTNCQTKIYEKLAVYYTKPIYWENLLSNLTNSELLDEQKINVMRLQQKVGVMKKPSEFTEMAQIALDQGLPGEAQAVLEEAFAKKLFVDDRSISLNNRLLAKAKETAAKDKAALAAKETAAKSAPTGDDLVHVGAAYLGYGDNQKALDVLKQGIAKGKLTNADEAGILLGIASLRTNNKAEAEKAFKSVKADPTMARIAKLWLLNT